MILRIILITLVTGHILSQDSRSRIRRPVLRVRPDTGPDTVSSVDDDDSKQARQLSRERSRIRRPQRRKPVENSFADDDDDTTLSRFAGSRGRPDPDEEEERPRFVPSNGGAKNFDRDPDRFSRNRGGSSSSSSFSNSISS